MRRQYWLSAHPLSDEHNVVVVMEMMKVVTKVVVVVVVVEVESCVWRVEGENLGKTWVNNFGPSVSQSTSHLNHYKVHAEQLTDSTGDSGVLSINIPSVNHLSRVFPQDLSNLFLPATPINSKSDCRTSAWLLDPA